MTDRTVLITGGSRGIGLATARVMGALGWSVAISGTRADHLRTAADILRREEIKPLTLCFRVENEEAWEDAIAQVECSLGSLNAVVCNAGISPKRDGRKIPFEETDSELWKSALDVNLSGVLLGFRAASKAFIASGKGGALVAVSSIAGRVSVPLASAYYTTAKTAVIGLVRGAAMDLGKHAIRANAVCPGRIDTDMVREAGDEFNRSLLPQIALGRLGAAEEVGEAIEFLCSKRASYITGTCLDVAGGWYAS